MGERKGRGKQRNTNKGLLVMDNEGRGLTVGGAEESNEEKGGMTVTEQQ